MNRTNVPLRIEFIAFEARRVLRRRALVAVQERAVELLDIDAAILHGLEGVRVLHQSARGLFRISKGAVALEHALRLVFLGGTAPRSSSASSV